ncbi:NAD(P)-dependent oxidoreductase [Neorhizobium sp. NPDC001467]|uniref:NAD(P)-dependent oxidoreductase n=1 Tax=Neorhizobium sp. NPDC001467 TaxID=3390595 RepID=UPI003CFE0F4C
MTVSGMRNHSSAMRKITILGATGPTGRHIVSQALRGGYDVTALVRSLAKASDMQGARLVVGDARDETALLQAIHGSDAVISALGTPASPFRAVTLLSSVTKSLVKAMEAENVSRLVAISGIGAGDSRGHGGFAFDRVIFPLLLRHVYADKNRQEAVIRQSGLDWTIVRPAVLNNKPARNAVRALTDLSQFHGGQVSREDVAKFVLDEVQEKVWSRQSPLIAW